MPLTVAYVSDPREWQQITGQRPTQYSTYYLEGQGRIPQLAVDAPGLIQALLKIVVRVGTLIYNRRHHDPEIGSIAQSAPPRESTFRNEPPSFEPAPLPHERLLEELTTVLDDVKRIRAELKQLKEGNIIEKALAAKRLKTDFEKVKADVKIASEDLKKELHFAVDGIKERVTSVKTDFDLLKGKEGRIAQIEAAARLTKNGLHDIKEGKHIGSVIQEQFRRQKEKSDTDGEGWSDSDKATHGGILGILTMLGGLLLKRRHGKGAADD